MAATIRRSSQNSNVYGAYGIVSSDNGRAVLAVGRNVLEIAYHLLGEQTTYRELGIDYFDRYRAERLKRRSLAQLQRLGYQITLQVTLTPLQTAA
jgi:hypothetical protein